MPLSQAEWKVMNVVWERRRSSVRDVLEVLEDQTGWAYSTVKTILARLVDKGVLDVSKRANTSLYEPLHTRNQARRAALESLLDRAFDGTFGSLVHHLIDDKRLSRRDREEIRTLLEGEPGRPEGRKP